MTISSNLIINIFTIIQEQALPEQCKKEKQINESNFKYIECAICLSQNYYLCQVVKMQINSKVQDFDTVSDSKQVTSTPKSAPNNVKRPKIDKRLSLMQPRDTLKLWRQSSSSMNREKSPSYRIPTAPRFSTTHQQEMKNSQFLTLQLRKQIGNKNSITFPHSKRPEHFIKADKIHTPSPATYKCSRFLQETHSAILPKQISLNNPETPVTASEAKKEFQFPILIPTINHMLIIQNIVHISLKIPKSIQLPDTITIASSIRGKNKATRSESLLKNSIKLSRSIQDLEHILHTNQNARHRLISKVQFQIVVGLTSLNFRILLVLRNIALLGFWKNIHDLFCLILYLKINNHSDSQSYQSSFSILFNSFYKSSFQFSRELIFLFFYSCFRNCYSQFYYQSLNSRSIQVLSRFQLITQLYNFLRSWKDYLIRALCLYTVF